MKEYIYKPEIGAQYGQWTIISEEIKKGSMIKGGSDRTSYWKVRCICGRETWRSSNALVYNKTNSCKSCCKTVNSENTFIVSYLNKVKRRVDKINVEFDLTPKYLEDIFIGQERKCALSGLDIYFRPNYIKNQQTASLDRIDNTKGYIKGNVQWVHKDINNMKLTHSMDYFIELCRLVSFKCS